MNNDNSNNINNNIIIYHYDYDNDIINAFERVIVHLLSPSKEWGTKSVLFLSLGLRDVLLI